MRVATAVGMGSSTVPHRGVCHQRPGRGRVRSRKAPKTMQKLNSAAFFFQLPQYHPIPQSNLDGKPLFDVLSDFMTGMSLSKLVDRTRKRLPDPLKQQIKNIAYRARLKLLT